MVASLARWVAGAALAMASGVGCTQALGLDKDYHHETDAGGGCHPMSDAAGACEQRPNTANLKAVPGGYCIDDTEVTLGQYLAWAAALPDGGPSDIPESCAFKKNAGIGWMPEPYADAGLPEAGLDLPVSFVDWCDAYVYCAANGKRLCGSIGGQQNTIEQASQCGVDQWYTVCSSGGVYTYANGNANVMNQCNAGDYKTQVPLPVTEPTSCVSDVPGYGDIFNMTGNMAEWVDVCTSRTEGSNAECLARGGSFSADPFLDQNCSAKKTAQRGLRRSWLGFRCCQH